MKYFYPGCKITARYPEGSQKLWEYLEKKGDVEKVGCCKVDYKCVEDSENTALLVCNSCAFDLKNLLGQDMSNIEYVFDLINNDSDFIFPDYHGMEVGLIICRHGYEDYKMEDTVCALLEKMNIKYSILEGQVPNGLSFEGHQAAVSDIVKHCDMPVVTYCGACNLCVMRADKKALYLMDVLFGTACI